MFDFKFIFKGIFILLILTTYPLLLTDFIYRCLGLDTMFPWLIKDNSHKESKNNG